MLDLAKVRRASAENRARFNSSDPSPCWSPIPQALNSAWEGGARPALIAPPIPKGIFATPHFSSRYEPGETVRVYAAICDGLRARSAMLGPGFPLCKIGATRERKVCVRIAGLSRLRYGAQVKTGADYVEETGFDHYRAHAQKLDAE